MPLAGPVSFFGFMLLGPAVLIMLRPSLRALPAIRCPVWLRATRIFGGAFPASGMPIAWGKRAEVDPVTANANWRPSYGLSAFAIIPRARLLYFRWERNSRSKILLVANSVSA